MRVRLLVGTTIAALSAGLLIVAGCGGGSDKLSAEEVISQAKKSTIEISGKGPEGEFGGTGVIIDNTGLALTNAHVVAGLTSLQAKVLDQTEVPIKVVATNPCEDVALVKLSTVPEGAEPIEMGKSSELKAGQNVTALGYPTSATDPGKETVVSTSGAVNVASTSSSISDNLNKFPSLIQHQARINPGNSGGPLVNDKAELVGINTLGNSELAQSYSITIDHVNGLLPDLKAGKSTNDMGWRIEPISTDLIAEYFGDTDLAQAVINYLNEEELGSTLFVTGVDAGTPAANARIGESDAAIEIGDLIIKINDTEVSTVADVCDILQSAQAGSELSISGQLLYSADEIDEIGSDWTVTTTLK